MIVHDGETAKTHDLLEKVWERAVGRGGGEGEGGEMEDKKVRDGGAIKIHLS